MGSICSCFKSKNTQQNQYNQTALSEPLTSISSSTAQINIEKEILVSKGNGKLEENYTIDKMLGEESSLASDTENFVKKVGKGFIKANSKAQRNFDNTAIGGYCKAFRTNIKKKLK